MLTNIIEHCEPLLNFMYNGKLFTFGHMHYIWPLRMIIEFMHQFRFYLTKLKIDQPHKWTQISVLLNWTQNRPTLHSLLWRSSGLWETHFIYIWVYFLYDINLACPASIPLTMTMYILESNARKILEYHWEALLNSIIVCKNSSFFVACIIFVFWRQY